MSKGSSEVKFELHPKRHVAPSWLAFLMAFFYVVVGVDTGFLIYKLLRGQYKVALCLIAIDVAVLIILSLSSQLFDWFKKSTVTFEKKQIVYHEVCPLSYSGNDSIRSKIKTIDSVRQMSRCIVVRGKIMQTDQQRKTSMVKKVKIMGVCDNRDELFAKLVEYQSILPDDYEEEEY